MIDLRATESRKLAVKALFKDHIEDGIQLSKMTCELAILRRLKHVNLVEVIEEFEDSTLHCVIMPLFVVRLSIIILGQLSLPSLPGMLTP